MSRRLVIIGNGMVGHKALELFIEKDGLNDWESSLFVRSHA